MSPADPLGTVVRVQLQTSPLKPGPRGARVYDPSPLLEVPSLQVGPRGAVGPDGRLDAHHADHPQSRNVRLGNGLSVLPRAHYARLRERFGPHVVDGSAGESLLLDTDGPLTAEDVAGPLRLGDGPDASLVLVQGRPMPPCVEFARWCLRRTDHEVDEEVEEALAVLADGARGFCAVVRGTGRVGPGLRLWRG